MNYWMLAAGSLSGLLLLAHVIGGRKEVHVPLLKSDLGPELGAYVSILWHAVTAVLAVGMVALFGAAMGLGNGAAMVVVMQYLAFVGLFLGYGVARLGSVWVMPQWVAFLLISILAGAGLW